MSNPANPIIPALGADLQPNQNNDAQLQQSLWGRVWSGTTGLSSSAVNGIWNSAAWVVGSTWTSAAWVSGGVRDGVVGAYNVVTSIPSGIAEATREIASTPDNVVTSIPSGIAGATREIA